MTDYALNDPATNVALLTAIEALTPLTVAVIRDSAASVETIADAHDIPPALVTLLRARPLEKTNAYTRFVDAEGRETYQGYTTYT